MFSRIGPQVIAKPNHLADLSMLKVLRRFALLETNSKEMANIIVKKILRVLRQLGSLKTYGKEQVDMTGKELLATIRKTSEERISEDGKIGVRYRNGGFQTLCSTCPGTVWNKVTEQYAEKIADELV